LRRTIGDRMSRSLREMAQLTLSSEADVTELVTQREARKSQAPALSYTALAARAVALSLPRHPYLNASLEGESIRLHSSLNLGIAVNLEDGLVVPVIKEAGARPAADLTAEIKRLGDLARAKGLTVEDNSGGTFTITNLGAFEVDVFTPIINPPQVAILGIGRIRDQAGIKDGQFSPRKMLWLSLTFDHRLVDGAPAAAFLKEVRERLENSAGLFD
jgi:pyruvate dehydrogenase E2 component (dihydrolipoamide acetyltransferase)